MVLDSVANFIRGSTDAAVDSTQTTVSVVDASIFPDPSTDGEYNVVVWDAEQYPRPDQDPNVEILRVTAVDTGTNDLTVTRGQEGTAGASHPSGSAIQLSPTAKMFEDIEGTFADFWDATNQNLIGNVDNSSVETDSLTVNEQAVQTALDGYVVPVSPGLGVGDAIDPSATTTPVSDARDEIVNNGSGAGTILYPPTTITEASTFTQTSNFISHIGWGSQVSVVEFTDLASDMFVFDDVDLIRFDGLTIDGSDHANRTAGSAWRFINGAMEHWKVGQVEFRKCVDPVIHMDTGHLYSSHISKLRGGGDISGRFIVSEDSFGPGLTIDNIRYSPNDNSTVVQLGESGVNITDCGFDIGHVNVGGAAGPTIEMHLGQNCIFDIGLIEDFGTNGGVSAKPHIVQVDSAGAGQIGIIRPTNQPPSYDYYVRTGPNEARDTIIMPPKMQGTLNNSAVSAGVQGGGSFNVVYLGPGGQITNNTAQADGNTKHRSLWDGGVEQ